MNHKALLSLPFLLLPLATRADHVDFVTVAATASPAYLARRQTPEGPKPETYLFLQGKFFVAGTRDPSVDHARFLDLADSLAPNLAKQNYHPSGNPKAADLLIVVNWGTTQTDYSSDTSNPEFEFQLQQLQDDIKSDQASGGPMVSGALAMDAQMSRTDAMSSAQTQNYNAHLLGYDAQLDKDARRGRGLPTISADEEAHRAALIDERYFVILLAYDYQDMLRRRAAAAAQKGKVAPPKPVWEVRMNVQAAGNNFTEALPAMARIASGYFGRNVDGLATEQADMTRNAHVEVGQPKVVGVVK